MNTLVLYYSRTGNNAFIANRIASELGCEIEQIIPKYKSYFLLLISSLTKIGRGNWKIDHDIGRYELIILCSPIWMGQIVLPTYKFLRGYFTKIQKLYFITCCASYENEKNGKFGYESVFAKIKNIIGEKMQMSFAIPIGLQIDMAKRKETNLMEIKLSNETFSGEILEKYEELINILRK
jgi:flavodoxin